MHSCPSVRMVNGMSYSSRYRKFSISQKKIFNEIANLLIRYVSRLKKTFDIKIIRDLKNELKGKGIEKIEYLEIRNEINLLSKFEKHNSRLFVAFYIDKIRIIDNYILY